MDVFSIVFITVNTFLQNLCFGNFVKLRQGCC